MKEIRRPKISSGSSTRSRRTTPRQRKLLQEIARLNSQQQQQDAEMKARLAEALRGHEEVYQLAPVCFVTLNQRGLIVGLNENSASLLSFPPAWLHDRPFLVFVARRDVRRFLALLSMARREPGQPATLDIELSVDGRLIPVQIWIKAALNEDKIIYRLVILDFSEIRAIERELKEALNNWYSLVESAPDVIMTIDEKGKILFVNRAGWGRLPAQLTGTFLSDYAREKDRKRLGKCIAQAFESGMPSTCELFGLTGDERRWYSFSFGSVRDTISVDRTTTVTIRDVSDQKRIEESLRASREQLREFAARLDAVREEERRRVAREIHDELGQALTILKMDLAWLQSKAGKDQNGTRKKIKSMIGDVDQTIESMRKIVTELRPSILDELGLTAAIEWQVAQIQERTGIRGFFKASRDDFKFSKDVTAAIFRIVQEGLTNVVRHAGANEVRVNLASTDGHVQISIADNGKGITRPQINDRKSFGIVGMRERVHRIGGEFNIFSVPGKGTRLEISIPLK
jgi:PAS domain S-box-containing protein